MAKPRRVIRPALVLVPLRSSRHNEAGEVATNYVKAAYRYLHAIVQGDAMAFFGRAFADQNPIVCGAQHHQANPAEMYVNSTVWRVIPSTPQEQPAVTDGILPNLEVPV